MIICLECSANLTSSPSVPSLQVVTGTQGIGYGISLIGFVWYNWIKAKSIAKGVAPKGSGSSTSYQAVPEMENGEGTPSKDEHSPRAYGK